MDLIPNGWKHILRNETTQKSLFKAFSINNQGPRKIKNSQKLFNKETCFTHQSNNTKCIKPFKGAEAT